MRDVTIVFPLRTSEVLLGFKKRGFGAGKWNGFGGKVEEETIREAAARELEEECGLHALAEDLEEKATIGFELPDVRFRAHVFTLERFDGEAFETEEMRPRWFSFGDIPYDTMWEDDRFWLPFVLDGQRVRGSFVFEDERIRRIDLTIDTFETSDGNV